MPKEILPTSLPQPLSSADEIAMAVRGSDLIPLRLVGVSRAVTSAEPLWNLEFAWEGQTQIFATLVQPLATPKRLADSLRKLTVLSAGLANSRPMLIAPYLPPERLRSLMTEGVSAVDLSGNVGIVVPERWFFLRTGNKNRYPSSAPIKNVYAGKSALVPRALLARGRFDTARSLQRDIEETAPITASTISKVLSSMREDLFVTNDGEIRVVQADAILTRLARNYDTIATVSRVQAKLELDDIGPLLDRNAIATKTLYAADGTALYTALASTSPLTRVYTSSIRALTANLTLDTESRFPTVEFVETDEVAPFYGRTKVNGIYRTSRLQVYLELQAGDTRARQSADALRESVLSITIGDR